MKDWEFKFYKLIAVIIYEAILVKSATERNIPILLKNEWH